ncbi:MAG: ATP-binding protein [Ruthenibacterium sp.]
MKKNEIQSVTKLSSEKLLKIIEDFKLLSVPIGVMILTAYPDSHIIFVNDMFARTLGYADSEELLCILQDFAWKCIYPDDIEYIQKVMKSRAKHFEPYEMSYRALKKDGSYLWVSQRSQHMLGENGEEFVFAYYRDITAQKHAEQIVETALHSYDVSIWEWDIASGVCCQSVHSSRCGMGGANVYENFPDCLFQTHHYHPDSVETAKSVFERIKKGERVVEALLFTYDMEADEYWWESVCYTTVFDSEGKPVKAIAVGKDVTLQKNLEKKIIDGAKKYETLVNSVPGGVGLYQGNATLTPIYISDQTFKLCNMTREEYSEITKETTLAIFHPDDVAGMLEEQRASLAEKRKLEYTHRVLQKDGSYQWMHVSGEWLTEQADGIPILSAVFTDVNEQMKAQQALRESELRYANAIKASNMDVWEYDAQTDVITIYSKSVRVNPRLSVVEHYIQSTLDDGYLRGDSVEPFLKVFKELRDGAPEASADLWFRTSEQQEYWCERVNYTNVFDAGGKPIKAYGIGHDVTKEKEAEKRYHDELSYREAMQNATMASININLTQNTILDFKSKFSWLAQKQKEAKTLEDYFKAVRDSLTPEKTQRDFAAVFNRNEMLRRFESGETTLSMEVTRVIDGCRYWTVITAHMMKRAQDSDIVAFLYSTDVTNEKMMQSLMNAIVKTDYDLLVVVDAGRNAAVRYSKNDTANYYARESDDFEAETHNYVRLYVCENDVAHLLQEITLHNILEQLDAHGSYSVFYAMPSADGSTFKKQLRFNYIDRTFKTILMARTDITQAFEEQEKKQQELAHALAIAEHANAAKSDFLSQVSHEIRTPINAIIGLTQVAECNLNDKSLIKECIDKSKQASGYLLSLINDILDMSKIESGKIVLKSEEINCCTFLTGVGTMIRAQAEPKGIVYSVTGAEHCTGSYQGDALRLQQILINILSNAVKFTPDGGKVTLAISEHAVNPTTNEICFKISDTGIGIGPEFLPNVFKAFEQEHHGTTAQYGGNGLGLSISRNLARLMGGDITVESTLGVGTVFTVHIPMQTVASPQGKASEENEEEQGECDFSGKRILLVEDHPMNILVAQKLLEHRHAMVEVAENGAIALAMFTAMPEYYYDAILMDIRMPVMDGLQATREIRALNGESAKTIPIIAMSANAFDDDLEKSKEAGMNLHLAKPIDAKLLYRALYREISRRNRRAVPE